MKHVTTDTNRRKVSASPLGFHRVVEPEGAVPQAAWRLDNSPEIWGNEILVELDALNLDAASFTQIKKTCNGNPDCIAKRAMEIVSMRGKHHNPETGSGGVFLGTVADIGDLIAGKVSVKKGDKIISLVSLTLTPLMLRKVKRVLLDRDQLEVEGHAILVEKSIFAKIPDDFSPVLTMAVLDVAGAAAQVKRLVKQGDRVLILGAGGKAGLLMLHEAMKKGSQVIAFIHSERSRKIIKEAKLAHDIIVGDARDAVAVMKEVERVTGGKMADLTINSVNITGTEMASILSTRDGGTVYFFSMGTSFGAAALGAEGAAKDVTMVIGNGYLEGHAEITLNVLRENAVLRRYFEERFA